MLIVLFAFISLVLLLGWHFNREIERDRKRRNGKTIEESYRWKDFELWKVQMDKIDFASFGKTKRLIEMNNIFNYTGQEKDARHLLVCQKLETAEDVAVMTADEVSQKIQEHFEVISVQDGKILLIKKEDMATFKSIAKFLMR